jgi:ABC-type multidrug transport system ATPase subunit
MGSQPLILDSIILHFDQKEVLHGAYMALEPTTVYGLYGINGSGKTTLMKVVMGILTPDSGTVFIQGVPQAERTIRERFSKIGYLPQGSFVPNDIGVTRLVRQFPRAGGFLDEFSTLGHARKTVGELSTGLRRYLEIRLILSLDRPIVLLDEPFTGLEPILIERVVQDIRSTRNTGCTILLTDHYHQYVEGAVDEKILLAGGRCRPLSSVDDARTELSRGN